MSRFTVSDDDAEREAATPTIIAMENNAYQDAFFIHDSKQCGLVKKNLFQIVMGLSSKNIYKF